MSHSQSLSSHHQVKVSPLGSMSDDVSLGSPQQGLKGLVCSTHYSGKKIERSRMSREDKNTDPHNQEGVYYMYMPRKLHFIDDYL